jgi:hypothetical protein
MQPPKESAGKHPVELKTRPRDACMGATVIYGQNKAPEGSVTITNAELVGVAEKDC